LDIRTGQLLDGPKEEWKPDLALVNGYYSNSGENRPVDLSTGDHTGSIRDEFLSHLL
jgi:hypothetical protein